MKPRFTPKKNLRVLTQGALLTYKASFTWLRPRVYFTMKVLAPLVYMAYFAYLGKFILGDEGMRYAALGNAVLSVAVNTVMGVVINVGTERWYGTLPALFVTPANRFFIFLGKAIVHIIDGIFSVVIGLAFAGLLFGVNFGGANFLTLAVVIVLTSVTLTGYGLLAGSYSLHSREVGAVFNAAFFSLMLLCGVNFSVDMLPIWLRPISYAIPLTYGIQATREAMVGASLMDVGFLLFMEVLTGSAMLLAGSFLFAYFEKLAKKKGTLETA